MIGLSGTRPKELKKETKETQGTEAASRDTNWMESNKKKEKKKKKE